MTTAKAQRVLLERLGAGATVLQSQHLALPVVPSWADGVDAEGRTVWLVGRHQLEAVEQGPDAIAAVLAALHDGHVPAGVHAVAYAPEASAAWAEIVMGIAAEILADGERGTGKTQMVPGALGGLAERHARAGHPLPLRCLWLHDALANASVKTARSLEAPLWAGCWQIRDDRKVAALVIGGVEYVLADFVGTLDVSAAERIRAECHVMAGDEVVASLDEGGGIEERKWDVARTSMRLPGVRHVAVAVTNPGAPDSWLYRRFIEGGGQPGTKRCRISASDRLSPEEVRALRHAFRDSPDLEARLALGEWSALQLGEQVGAGWDPGVHVASTPMRPDANYTLAIGWDGGHSPSAVIGQLIGGQVRIYAALNDLKVGVLELIEDQVFPWLTQYAPWARQQAGALVHVIDPSMATPGQATITESAERVIRDTLKGRIVHGPVAWSPRREAVLRVLAPRHEGGVVPFQVNGGPETAILRGAFTSRWYYPRTPSGSVDRSRPKKPNSPWSDVGDAAAYLLGWLRPGTARDEPRNRQRRESYRAKTAFDPLDYNHQPERSRPWPR